MFPNAEIFADAIALSFKQLSPDQMPSFLPLLSENSRVDHPASYCFKKTLASPFGHFFHQETMGLGFLLMWLIFYSELFPMFSDSNIEILESVIQERPANGTVRFKSIFNLIRLFFQENALVEILFPADPSPP